MREGPVGRASGGCGHHLVEKGFAGGALVLEGAADRAAGVNEEAEGEGEIVVAIEVADGLRMAVDGEHEVGLCEVGDEGAVLIADDDGQIDELGGDGDGGRCGGRSGCVGGLGASERPAARTAPSATLNRGRDCAWGLDEGWGAGVIWRSVWAFGVLRSAFSAQRSEFSRLRSAGI